MIDLQKIDELAQRFGAALPPGAQQFRSELEAQFRAILSRGLQAMDLVTREEFDLQKAALERAQAQMKALQERLEALEQG
ncbi:MAG: accessory factor UbiK family protein [Gammaproteobacteria bacterium]